MKHISSIRSIYFKRFVLAALLGVVSISAWADSGNTYGRLTAETDPNSEPNSDSNGAGKIYISTTALTDQTLEANEYKTPIDITCFYFLGYYSSTTFYCYARETEKTKGLWAGWYDNTGALQGGGAKDIEYAAQPESTKKNDPTSFSLTAKWVQPKVTSSDTLNLGTITDKTADVPAQTVTLNIADYSKTEHFKAEPSTVNGFSTTLLSTTKPDEDWKGTASVEVDYTPSGKHGEHKATAYLASSLYD